VSANAGLSAPKEGSATMERGDVAKQMAPRCAPGLAVPCWVPLLAESSDAAIVGMPFIECFYSNNDLDELRSVR
jgi:hypothetical protein